MFIRSQRRSKLAFTLPETIVVIAISTLFLAGVMSTVIFMMKSSQSLVNYFILSSKSQQKLAILTQDVRSAQGVSSYTSNSISLYYISTNGVPSTIGYTYSPSEQILYRFINGDRTNWLTNCLPVTNAAGTALPVFSVWQRNMYSNSFDNYLPTTVNFYGTVKVVQVNWNCFRKVVGLRDTESVQTAKIVIRNQKQNQ